MTWDTLQVRKPAVTSVLPASFSGRLRASVCPHYCCRFRDLQRSTQENRVISALTGPCTDAGISISQVNTWISVLGAPLFGEFQIRLPDFCGRKWKSTGSDTFIITLPVNVWHTDYLPSICSLPGSRGWSRKRWQSSFPEELCHGCALWLLMTACHGAQPDPGQNMGAGDQGSPACRGNEIFPATWWESWVIPSATCWCMAKVQ